ncbi:MAG: ribonuclease III [Planctomycetaceae bacterium]
MKRAGKRTRGRRQPGAQTTGAAGAAGAVGRQQGSADGRAGEANGPPVAAPTTRAGDGGVPPGIDLAECQRRIGYAFRDEALLRAALTHASGAVHRLASNERLEFLGDSILGFIVCEHLYRAFPESLEGDLTRIKSVVVSRETCGRISERLGLTDFLIVGKGLASNRQVPLSVLSDLFESVVAAVYLDGGIGPVRALVGRWLEPEIAEVSSGALGANHKSLLQQLAQREYGVTPTYEVVEETGPDHSKSFRVSACLGDRRHPAAWGRNKKEAEQRAAANALEELLAAAGDPGEEDG